MTINQFLKYVIDTSVGEMTPSRREQKSFDSITIGKKMIKGDICKMDTLLARSTPRSYVEYIMKRHKVTSSHIHYGKIGLKNFIS
jgi:response regulator of citrate/malate metabolism